MEGHARPNVREVEYRFPNLEQTEDGADEALRRVRRAIQKTGPLRRRLVFDVTRRDAGGWLVKVKWRGRAPLDLAAELRGQGHNVRPR